MLKFVNKTAIPEVLGVPGSVGQTTLWRFMHEWGFKFRRASKDIYYDGHEREDVVAYHKLWSKRMVEYKKCMEVYQVDCVENVIQPSLIPDEKKLVLVTHDESTFYANDGKQQLWLGEGEIILRNKNPGQWIMVSEFQCACHGTMRVMGWSSRTFIKAGVNRDGYWTSEDMVKQLKEDAIPLFENLHPDCRAIFIFDQSSNHKAYPRNALVTRNMKKGPTRCGVVNESHDPEKHEYRFGRYYCQICGEQVEQDMYEQIQENIVKKKRGATIVTADKQTICQSKGMQKILQERGLWLQEDPYRPGKDWRADCKGIEASDSKCCGRHYLAAQPDFQEQRSALCEAVKDAGHIFELYPKFHCECNWIERYWGASKREARINCDYTFKALESNIPAFLDKFSPVDGPPLMIRRFYNRAWRIIEAYADDEPTDSALKIVEEFSSRHYPSHCRIGRHN